MKSTPVVFLLFAVLLNVTVKAQITVSGELRTWHKVTLTLNSGIATGETAVPNPFTDYRLNVTFTKGSKSYLVPGYFAADGNAANTGAQSGSLWRAHFCPDEDGVWNYSVSFKTGTLIAISDNANAGTPVAPLNGLSGTITVLPTNKSGNDFRGKGKLEYAGNHHLRFAGSGKYFVKGGSCSPENFLAYYEFDGTYDAGGIANTLTNGLHQYPDHVQDWHTGDPAWQNGKGKAIIGSLNYLASTGVNALGFIVMNIKGDGDDVWPYVSHNAADRERFDVSKLAQWEIVFSHMDSLGIALHLVLSERENQMLLDNGELGNQRRLFYRELIARFSHHLAVLWDLGEENGRDFLNRGFQNDQQRKDMATYFKTHDPYKSFVCLNAYDNTPIYRPLLGYPDFDGTSQQDYYQGVHSFAINWRDSSEIHGRKWVIFHDETRGGISPDGATTNHSSFRKNVLWGNLMGGGGGVEWYFGNEDLNCESFRTRASVWSFTRHALAFFNNYLPFEEMKNYDALTSSTADYCFALPGKVYAVYIPNNSSTNINLPCGNYTVKWYDPKTGGALQNGSVVNVSSGNVYLGAPPYPAEDWVALVTSDFSVAFDIINTGGCSNPLAQVRVNPAGGVTPYSFLWSNGVTTQTASGLTPGNYSVTVTDGNGCTTSGNVNVSNQGTATYSTRTVTICSGAQYFAGGAWQVQSGTYYDTLTGAGNCDSVVITTLTVRTPIVKNISVTICQGDSYYTGGNFQTQPGTYSDVQTSASGCDSTIITQLSVISGYTSQRQIEICDGDSLFAGGNFQTTSGTYYDTLSSAQGCDSVVITMLAVEHCDSCTIFDCNKDCNGSAYIDQCGICVGGNTGKSACTDCVLRVNSLSLMYEGTFGEVTQLTNGLVISKDTLCRFNIRANLCRLPVGSVKFLLNGNTFRVENGAPHAINGDSPSGHFTPWMPAPGNYTVTAIPYSGSNASGTAGTSCTVTFTIINPSGGTPAACTTPTTRDCSGKVNGSAYLDGCGICSGGTTGHAADSDKDNCGVCFGNNSTCCQNASDCNDNNACTNDNCQNGICAHAPVSCDDNDGCTVDNCSNGACQHTPHDCNDNFPCTQDFCTGGQCRHTLIPGQSCCVNNSDCSDSDECTSDICSNGQCLHQPLSTEPAYLKVVNPARSWRKLKLGYSSTNIWSPKLDVTAGGNHTVCITLRDPLGNAEWNKIQMRPQASSANAIALSNYLPQGGIGNSWTTLCIPLAAFNGFNFTQISYFEFPFSNGANAFEIHIRKIEFTGGATPFLWFGDSKTDNYHDGQSGSPSALIAQVVPGQVCGSAKQEAETLQNDINEENEFIHAYPNPFSNELQIDFALAESSVATLEIYNLTGQLLGTLFDGEVKQSEIIHARFDAEAIPSGMLIYRLKSIATQRYGKVMLSK